ncbi:hypothetical protein IFR05_003954, partial [Cadophora sp. M221]
IEADYQKFWTAKKKARREWDAAGYANRYMSISYIDDSVSKKRTVTMVEDMNLLPAGARGTMSCGRVRSVHQVAGVAGNEAPLADYRALAVARANKEAAPWPPTQFVSPRVESESIAPLLQAVRNEEERSGNEYANGALPRRLISSISGRAFFDTFPSGLLSWRGMRELEAAVMERCKY